MNTNVLKMPLSVVRLNSQLERLCCAQVSELVNSLPLEVRTPEIVKTLMQSWHRGADAALSVAQEVVGA